MDPQQKRARAESLHRTYLDQGIQAAAEESGLTRMRIYQIFKEYGLGAGRFAARAHAPAVAPVAPLPARAPVHTEKSGFPSARVHQGSVKPGSQVGHIEMPCPNCGHLLIQSLVLRAAGAR